MDTENQVAKQSLRNQYRQRREQMGLIRRQQEAGKVCLRLKRLIRQLSDEKPLTVAAYLANGTELPLDSLFDAFLPPPYPLQTLSDPKKDRVRFYAPYMDPLSTELDFAPLPSTKNEREQTWRRSRFGILEPPPEQLDRAFRPDVILVPCLAVDRYGNRLGQGKACYDRYLHRLKDQKNQRPFTALAVLFDEQLAEEALPRDLHDYPLDLAVCASEILVFSERGQKVAAYLEQRSACPEEQRPAVLPE